MTRGWCLRSLNGRRGVGSASSLISGRAKLDAAVIRTVDIQWIAAGGRVRGFSINRGVNAYFFQFAGDPFRIEVVNADADVIHGARICQLVDPEKSIAQAEIDPAVARAAHDL